MATLMDAIQHTLVQEILPAIYSAAWDLDAFYPMVRRSWHKVKRNRGIGRGFTVTKNWSTGMAGGARFQSAQGSNVLSGPQNFNMYGTPQRFPGIDEVTAPAYITSTVDLLEQQANLYIPHHILRADKLDASITSVLADNLRGVGELVTQQEMALFYSTAPTQAALVDLGNTSDTVSNVSGDTAAIDVDMGHANSGDGRIHRLRQGMMVDLYDDTGTTKRNTNFYIVVDNVDPIAQTFRLRRVDGGELQTTTTLGGGVTYATAGGDDDIVVIKDSVGYTPGSLESWIADGSSITDFFDIDVTDFGQYKSYVPAAISAALTDTVLNRHVGWFYESFPGKKLTAALTTLGVLLGFIDNLDTGYATDGNPGRMRYERQGRALDVEAGWHAFKYYFAGRPLNVFTSTYCQSGNFYAGDLINQVTRYVPPPIGGAKVDQRFGMEIEYLAPLGGSGFQGIFKHAHDNGRTTNFVECPMVRQWVCMPNKPNFLKLSSITEVIGE